MNMLIDILLKILPKSALMSAWLPPVLTVFVAVLPIAAILAISYFVAGGAYGMFFGLIVIALLFGKGDFVEDFFDRERKGLR